MDKPYFIREPRDRSYTVVDNTFIRDERLSWRAKGLFTYLLSLPEDWKIYLSEIQKHSIDGETALRSAVSELVTYGYLETERRKDSSGRWCGIEYKIIEIPQESPINKDSSRDSGLRDTVLRDTVNQALVNTNSNQILKNSKNKKIGNSEPLVETVEPIKIDKRNKRSVDIITMKKMINEFSDDSKVFKKLEAYFNFRVGKGLEVGQWRLILDHLREFCKGDMNVAIQKIDFALAGGYMVIIPSWELNKMNSKPSFDNTATKVKKTSGEIELAKNKDGEIEAF